MSLSITAYPFPWCRRVLLYFCKLKMTSYIILKVYFYKLKMFQFSLKRYSISILSSTLQVHGPKYTVLAILILKHT